MPCRVDDYSPTDNEHHRLARLMREITRIHSDFNSASNDQMTQRLCKWCNDNKATITKMTPDLQDWWRKHQEWDRRRQSEDRLKKSVKAKLTAEELAFIGWKR